MGPTQPFYNGYWVFPGVKRPGRGADHPSSTEVEGRVELYICSPSGSSWPVLGRTFRKVQLEYLVMIDCVYEDKIWYSVKKYYFKISNYKTLRRGENLSLCRTDNILQHLHDYEE